MYLSYFVIFNLKVPEKITYDIFLQNRILKVTCAKYTRDECKFYKTSLWINWTIKNIYEIL